MPNTFLARFLAEQITVERRLSSAWAGLIARLQTLVERYARMNPTAITWEPVTAEVGYPIAPALREQFLHDVDRELLTFYGGRDPYRVANGFVIPTSELMRALWPSLVAAGKLGFERQMAILEAKLTKHPALWAAYQPIWHRKTSRIVREQDGGGRPEAIYDPPHLWVDPNGYRLSDRIWATSEEDRRKLHLFMNDAINQGTGSATLSKQLEQFLLPGKTLPSTNKPYGRDLSYNTMRLARTEIASAYNRADHAAAVANPFVTQYNVRLSRSHPKVDICDTLADGGPYDKDDTSAIPPGATHPMCLCTIEWVVNAPMEDVIAQMRVEIAAEFPDKILPSGALDLRGVRLPEVGIRMQPGSFGGPAKEIPVGIETLARNTISLLEEARHVTPEAIDRGLRGELSDYMSTFVAYTEEASVYYSAELLESAKIDLLYNTRTLGRGRVTTEIINDIRLQASGILSVDEQITTGLLSRSERKILLKLASADDEMVLAQIDAIRDKRLRGRLPSGKLHTSQDYETFRHISDDEGAERLREARTRGIHNR